MAAHEYITIATTFMLALSAAFVINDYNPIAAGVFSILSALSTLFIVSELMNLKEVMDFKSKAFPMASSIIVSVGLSDIVFKALLKLIGNFVFPNLVVVGILGFNTIIALILAFAYIFIKPNKTPSEAVQT